MNRRSIFNEKEAVEAGAHRRRGGRVHVELSGGDAGGTRGTARDIPNHSCARAQRRQVSVKAHRTTGAQTTEPKHHNSESVNDVRVSPIGGGVGVVEEDELSTCGTTTPDCQRISSAVTPNNTKSAS